MTVEEKMKM